VNLKQTDTRVLFIVIFEEASGSEHEKEVNQNPQSRPQGLIITSWMNGRQEHNVDPAGCGGSGAITRGCSGNGAATNSSNAQMPGDSGQAHGCIEMQVNWRLNADLYWFSNP
jgi:hypothetical protein